MKNEFKCTACDGSGKKWEECPDYHKPHIKKNEKGVCISHCSLAVDALCGFNNDIAMQCPTCKTGDMAVGVKGQCLDCSYDRCDICEDVNGGYRPLTDAELEELMHSENFKGEMSPTIINGKLDNIRSIEGTFKGAPVKLIPIEGGKG